MSRLEPVKNALRISFVLLGVVSSLQAAELALSERNQGQSATNPSAAPLAAQQITQSLDPFTVVGGTSVGCVSATSPDHHYWRVFDLDAEFDLVGDFCVESVDYAIEIATGSAPRTTANVYCLDDGSDFVLANLDLVGTAVQTNGPAQLEFFHIEVGGCCDSATESLVVELAGDDCQATGTCGIYFIGMNDLGQTAPSYISAPDCGIVDPVDLALIGFPNSHVIMVVNGQGEGQDDVPATSGLGAVLAVVLLLAASAWLLRRKGDRPQVCPRAR